MTTWVSQYQKGRPILDFNKARDAEMAVTPARPCKSFALYSREITTPAPYHSIFYVPSAILDALLTM